ncbi:MAG TPA: hypothetical protein VMV87_14030 [Burkholderiales bacterium]|nr:hypothetical protein [Burkholderiales bacterium]
MKTGTHTVAALVAGSCLALAAVASIAASRERIEATSTTTSASSGKMIPGSVVDRSGSGTASRYDESFVKWIPVLVPLLAVLLAVGTYFIFGMIR